MSIKLSKAELRRFLATPGAEVLCVRGAWGTGKTFALREVVEDMALKNELALERYSYVSLFGLDGLSNVRSAIFDNTVRVENLLPGSSTSGFFDSLADLETLARKSKGLQGFLPGNWGRSGATAVVDRATFAFVRNQIICFDDLERASRSIAIKDILGLTTFLKEERSCKVILILNESKLDGDEKADFDAQFEKVVDSSIVLEPSITDVISIAVKDKFDGSEYLKDAVEKLDIRNIRVISKIIRIIRMIQSQCELDEVDLRQVVATSALAGWTKFQGGDAVTLSDLRSYNGLLMRMRAQRDGAEPLPSWAEKPEALGYSHSDEVDLVIIEALDKGYVDPNAFSAAKEARKTTQEVKPENEEFSKAWRVYHENLNKDDREVAEGLFNGMRTNYVGVSLLNFNATISLFRELGYNDLADAAIKEYFAAQNFDRKALDDDISLWGREPIDPSIVAHFEKLKEEYVDPRDPLDVLVRIANNSGWNQEDIDLLESLPPDEWVKVFDRVPGRDLTTVLKFAIRFVASTETAYAKFGSLIATALKEIAGRSPMNARKLRSLGLKLET